MEEALEIAGGVERGNFPLHSYPEVLKDDPPAIGGVDEVEIEVAGVTSGLIEPQLGHPSRSLCLHASDGVSIVEEDVVHRARGGRVLAADEILAPPGSLKLLVDNARAACSSSVTPRFSCQTPHSHQPF